MLADALGTNDAGKIRQLLTTYTQPEASAYQHVVTAALWINNITPAQRRLIGEALPSIRVVDVQTVEGARAMLQPN